MAQGTFPLWYLKEVSAELSSALEVVKDRLSVALRYPLAYAIQPLSCMTPRDPYSRVCDTLHKIWGIRIEMGAKGIVRTVYFATTLSTYLRAKDEGERKLHCFVSGRQVKSICEEILRYFTLQHFNGRVDWEFPKNERLHQKKGS